MLKFCRNVSLLDKIIRTGVDRILPRNLTIRYITALITLATLAVSGQVMIQTSLARQTEDQHRAQLLDRQIHDSEVLRKAVFSLQLSHLKSQIKVQIELIESLVQQFKKNGIELRSYLANSGSWFFGSEELAPVLKRAEISFSDFIKNYPLLGESTLSPSSRPLDTLILSLLSDELNYRTSLIELSKYYEQSLSQQITEFKNTELILLFITLLVLALEALYVFRPSVESLYEALHIRSDFLGRMGHELRNPMNSILGMTHLLQETELSDLQKEYLNILNKSGTGLLDTLNNLLDFSSIESGSIRIESIPFDLHEVLERSIDLAVYGAHSNGIHLVLELESNVPLHLIGDPFRLQQILTNLLGNAVKFTTKGEVTLAVQLKIQEEQAWVEFAVSDTGMGISPDQIEKIFSAFVQGDSTMRRRFGGTGLGLSISQDLVSLLGGALCVESKKDIGSRFFFTLPFTVCELKEAQESHPIVHSQKPLLQKEELRHDERPLKVLVVDDSRDNQFLVNAYLSSLPYQLSFASDGKEALELFKDNPFDIVLMDLQMPIMDGYTATRTMREWEQEEGLKPTPIVAVSAHDHESSKERFKVADFSSYLIKPISPHELRDTIATLTQKVEFNEWRQQQTPLLASDGAIEELERQLSDLKPQYLKNRLRELKELKEGLNDSDFTKIQNICHRVKGNAKSYGFEELGQISGKLEEAAHQQDPSLTRELIAQAELYLSQFTVTHPNST